MPIPDDDQRRRLDRRARQQQVRRRRAAALVAVLVVAGAIAGAVAALSAGGGSPRSAATSTEQKTTPTRPHRRHRSKPRLEQRAQRATERFARLGLPLYCGGGTGRYIALTFDDGPGPYTTRYAFRILRQAGLRATFFDVGRLLASWPGIPRRELAFGAVGDHTWTHPYLPGLSASAMRQEIASTQGALEKATGQPVRLFRPPYGARNASIDATATSLGMVEVLWSIDSLDSQGADWNGITRQVLNNLRPGSIVLMHENRGQTIRALKFNIIPTLKREGWKTVSVPELLALDPPSTEQLHAGAGGCGSPYVPKPS